jgi:energy coupling factor transporter S component ThiW
MSQQVDQERGQHLRRLLLAAMFAALATLLGSLSVPWGPTKVAPFQHTVNAIAGILIGPWYAAAAALVTATLRYSLHTGSVFAFPGSPFGALVVGYAYLWLRRDTAALFEPIGTGLIGGTIAGLIFAPLIGSSKTAWFFIQAFLASSVPGAILGYVVIRALRRIPVVAEWAEQSR